MALSGRKRPSSTSLESSGLNRPRKRQAAKCRTTTQRSDIKINVDGVSDNGETASLKTPRNAQATLGGLPAELRLQIYDYLCESTIIHVHRQAIDKTESRFIWTPCRLPNPTCPLLCANPKWTGMCAEKDRCTYKVDSPPEPRGFWAMAVTCKFIRNEAQEFFIRNSVISIHPQYLRCWLDYIDRHNPKQIEQLRRITLAGPNLSRYSVDEGFQLLRDRVPNLEGVGFQCQEPFWRWVFPIASHYDDEDIQVKSEAWRRWDIAVSVRAFDPAVTIALEATMWRRYHAFTPNIKEQQFVVRIIRAGTHSKDNLTGGRALAWADENVQVEINHPGKLIAPKKNAGWRQWWLDIDMKRFM